MPGASTARGRRRQAQSCRCDDGHESPRPTARHSGWLPASVVAEARRLHALYTSGNTAQRTLAITVKPLAMDPRMRVVWENGRIAAIPERMQVYLFRAM